MPPSPALRDAAIARGVFGAALALTALTALAVAGCVPSPPLASGPSEDERTRIAEEIRRIESPADDPAAAGRHYAAKRRRPDPAVPLFDLYRAAGERMRRMPRHSLRWGRLLSAAKKSRARSPGSLAEAHALGAWEPLGPGNIGGRTRALLVDPERPGTLYAAGVSGGIWKTTDGGGRWAPLGDELVNIAVNSMAMDPSDPRVIYAGTGEGYLREEIRGTGLPLRGAGIFKSVDGVRFARLASTAGPDFHWVNDLAVSSADSRRVYAATRSGVWRSLDAGQSWSRVLAVSVRGGCLDLALRTDQASDTLFAACGTLERAAVYRNEAAEGEAGWVEVLSEAGMGRTSLALAPSDQDVIYALAASHVPGPQGRFDDALHAVFRSTDGGRAGSWEARLRNTSTDELSTLLLTNPVVANLVACGFEGSDARSSLGWYANVIAVDPTDPEVLWAGGVDLFRSDDGGVSWGPISYWWSSPPSAHADQHVVVFHPDWNGGSNQTLFLGGDGGVWRTDNARAAKATGARAVCNPAQSAVRWRSLNRNYGVTQFYHGAPYPDGRRFLGGTQDNGTLRGTLARGVDGWEPILGGDGGYVAVDPQNPQVLYAESQFLGFRKSVDGGESWELAMEGITESTADVLFIVPFVMDPSDRRRLWWGGSRLWRTSDGAASWKLASGGRFDAGGKVSAVAVDPASSARVAAGLDNGYVFVSENALAAAPTWRRSRPRPGYVTWTAFDPSDPSVLYATYAEFGGDHVWKSLDAGASWTSIDGEGATGLPDLPVHSIVVDPLVPDRLFLGTDLGVFVSLRGGGSWAVENTGFARAVTESLALAPTNEGGGWLFAFTHGRGAWRVPLVAAAPGLVELVAETLTVSEGETATLSLSRTDGATGEVSVQVETIAGSALPGEDFTGLSRRIGWSDGDAAPKTLSVEILDDGEPEGPETFDVRVSDPRGGAELGARTRATVVVQDDDGGPASCGTDDGTALCLAGRFAVRVTWRDPAGSTGAATVAPGSPAADSGVLWFFSPHNWDLLVKVVDGCALNDRFWVFSAATTNVEYVLQVTDTAHGASVSYFNPQGRAAPAVTDTDALATCP